jgi:hypothetical protein
VRAHFNQVSGVKRNGKDSARPGTDPFLFEKIVRITGHAKSGRESSFLQENPAPRDSVPLQAAVLCRVPAAYLGTAFPAFFGFLA